MNPILRHIARGLLALVACLLVVNGLASLSGCNVSRATAEAPEPLAAPTAQPVDGSHWQACA